MAPELHRRPQLSRVIFIGMTAHGRQEDRKRAQAAGFREHLVKPLDMDVLEALLAQPPTADREAEPR
jgi:two-component system CheB/CheR fusion protein